MDPFNSQFWIREWEKKKPGDTHRVHKGFATPEYWDKAAFTYNKSPDEIKERRLNKTLEILRSKDLFYDGVNILDIGCGTGLHAMAFAEHGARVTALDFSSGMLDRCRRELRRRPDLAHRIELICEDWEKLDIRKKKWERRFDVAVAFMSPGIALPEPFFKMMACAKKGCAIRSWAAKRENPIMETLWEKIMDKPLEDRPQTVFYKINLLFSLGMFPDVHFDPVEWDQRIGLEDEYENQLAFFKKVSSRPRGDLEKMIREHLSSLCAEGYLSKKQKSITATAVWTMEEGVRNQMPSQYQ